jgi:Domain of unknown function (DUF6249)
MKVQILAVCLLATLAGAGRAESAPTPAPEPDVQASSPELKSDLQELESEVRRVDPQGRLTSDQLFQLLIEREQQRANLTHAQFDPAPIIISIFLFSSLLTGFLAWLYAGFRKERQRHETVRLMVEKGAEIPSGLLAPAPKVPKRPSDLRRGLILSTAGLGLTIFLASLPDAEGAWGAGLTLCLIGVGHLLVWRIQGGKGSWSSALASEPQP